MKFFRLVFILLLLVSLKGFSQCSETNIIRVMLIGDSWASLMGTDQSIDQAFTRWGHSNYKFFTNAILSESGTETADFLTPTKLNEIQSQLISHPDIDFVHVSLGGNDVLNTWNVNFTPALTSILLDSVYHRLTLLFDFIKSVRPGIRIVWSGYSYPNFGEIINDLAPFQTTHPFYSLWQGMGFPNFLQINSLLNTFSNSVDTAAANDPQLFFTKATGLMQYTFGQGVPLGVPPGGSYAPFTAPLPEGHPDYPSPKISMRNYIIFKDCFHLSPDGYLDFMEYHTKKYYQKALMDNQYILLSGGNSSGSVSASGNVTNQLQLGNFGNDDIAAMLSFNTTSIPDTGIESASLFLRRESITGLNPVDSTLLVTVKSGFFGNTQDVESSDYSDAGSATDIACRFGSNNVDGDWFRIDLPPVLLPYITNNSITQFRITSPGAAGTIFFSDATDPELTPVLNLKFTTSSGIAENIANGAVKIYPNPTNGDVFIVHDGIDVSTIFLYDIQGKKLMELDKNVIRFSISDLESGFYFLSVHTPTGIKVQKIVKR